MTMKEKTLSLTKKIISTTTRKLTKELKAKVVLESLKERETLESLAKKYELLPTQISTWKAQALQNFGQVFSSDKQQPKERPVDIEKLYSQIGQLKVENDFLKKKFLCLKSEVTDNII